MKHWKETLAVAVFIAGFFLALNEDFSNGVNAIGATILIAGVLYWGYRWFNQGNQK